MIQNSEGTRLLPSRAYGSPTVAHLVTKENAAADALLVEAVLAAQLNLVNCCASDGCITSDILLRYNCIKANATRSKGDCRRLGTVGSNLCSLHYVSQRFAGLLSMTHSISVMPRGGFFIKQVLHASEEFRHNGISCWELKEQAIDGQLLTGDHALEQSSPNFLLPWLQAVGSTLQDTAPTTKVARECRRGALYGN